MVSFRLAPPAWDFQDLESNTAERYWLMKTMRAAWSAGPRVGFPVNYDECHMRTCLLCWLQRRRQWRLMRSDDGRWLVPWTIAGHQSCVRASSGDRRPFTSRFLWCELQAAERTAHASPLRDVYDQRAPLPSDNGLMTSGSCQRLNGTRSVQRAAAWRPIRWMSFFVLRSRLWHMDYMGNKKILCR